MARKKKRSLTRYERRRIRRQQVFFGLIALIIIASFIVSLVTAY